MLYTKKVCSIWIIIFTLLTGCKTGKFNIDSNLKYCTTKTGITLSNIPNDTNNIPRSISTNSDKWRYVGYKDWTSGFWPGILWYSYEASNDTLFKIAADKFSSKLIPLAYTHANDHDLGFRFYCSYGNGYRLTGNENYKKILLAAADTLATLYNPHVGTLLSWPLHVKEFGPHNTIIDNMMNLELLFWASKNGGSKNLYDIAVKHALTTMNNHFRKNYSSYHVILYDSVTGKKIKGVTHQGYNDSSMWARGQSWAIYGFTLCYRETMNPVFLDFAQKVADVYLNKLPKDLIPVWDFNYPDKKPKDVSAACITASALIELSQFIADKTKADYYLQTAKKIIDNLSSSTYQSRRKNSAFLLHSTGNKSAGIEINASIIYADYYYLEALLRLNKIYNKK